MPNLPDRPTHHEEEIIYLNLTDAQRLVCLTLAVTEWVHGVDDRFLTELAVDRAILSELVELLVIKQFSLVDILREQQEELRPQFEAVQHKLAKVVYKQLPDEDKSILNQWNHLQTQLQRAAAAGDIHFRLYSPEFQEAVIKHNPRMTDDNQGTGTYLDDYLDHETNDDDDTL